jgi:hypothetical protein
MDTVAPATESVLTESQGKPAEVRLCMLGCNIRIQCADDYARALLLANYGACVAQSTDSCLSYSIRRRHNQDGFTIIRDGRVSVFARDDTELLSLLEEDMIINVQMRRRDLYFLHSAALEYSGRGFLLIAPSGGGKSTTSWGLLQHGFGYMSDELAPIRLSRMTVYPYPHAICLKAKPPQPYNLPNEVLHTAKTMHIPAAAVPSQVQRAAVPLTALVFLQRNSPGSDSAMSPISKAEAAARVYANALNPLAHKCNGFDGAAEIVQRAWCFQLVIGDLSRACALTRETAELISKARPNSHC